MANKLAVNKEGVGIKVTHKKSRVKPNVKPHGKLFHESPQVKPAEYTPPTFKP